MKFELEIYAKIPIFRRVWPLPYGGQGRARARLPSPPQNPPLSITLGAIIMMTSWYIIVHVRYVSRCVKGYHWYHYMYVPVRCAT